MSKNTEKLSSSGELVCTAPFPNMPLYFWNDPDNKKYAVFFYKDDSFVSLLTLHIFYYLSLFRYHATYFSVYPNVWYHGDFAEITDTGGMIITGR
jgi:acetoacetyl-CoA synthetase